MIGPNSGKEKSIIWGAAIVTVKGHTKYRSSMAFTDVCGLGEIEVIRRFTNFFHQKTVIIFTHDLNRIACIGRNTEKIKTR